MAQGLCLTYLQLPAEGDPNYPAGHRAVDGLTLADVDLTGSVIDAVEHELETAGAPSDATDDWPTDQDLLIAVQRRLHRRIDELRTGYTEEEAIAEVAVFWLFGRRVLFTGGPTWGDPPSDLFEVISELSELPVVLQAMGCDLDLPT
jgi:hypothetical protein